MCCLLQPPAAATHNPQRATLDGLITPEVDFGNGRYVRNIFEQAKLNQASRLIEKDIDTLTPDDITTITEEDIILPETANPKKMQIGFC